MIKLLLWIGLVRRNAYGTIRWPFDAPPKHAFKSWKAFKHNCRFWGYFYVFRNRPGVIKWEKGRLLPRRWGFGICGFEFGDRG